MKLDEKEEGLPHLGHFFASTNKIVFIGRPNHATQRVRGTSRTFMPFGKNSNNIYLPGK